MVASFSPENTFSAMILLQASICWSAGVVSDVQSGPSWLRCWAGEAAGHSAAASSAKSRMNLRMKCPGKGDESLVVLLRAGGWGFMPGRRLADGILPGGRTVLGLPGQISLPTGVPTRFR